MFAFSEEFWFSIIALLTLAGLVVGMVFLVIFLTKRNRPTYRDFDERDELERENARLRREVAELKRDRSEPSSNDPLTRQRETGYSDNESR
jgi:hypothetical protein